MKKININIVVATVLGLCAYLNGWGVGPASVYVDDIGYNLVRDAEGKPLYAVCVGPSPFAEPADVSVREQVTATYTDAYGEEQYETFTVKEIQANAFTNLEYLRSVTIADGITVIGAGVFQNSRNLKSVSLPSGLEEIPEHCFGNTESLRSISIPAGVRVIGQEAFYHSGIESVSLSGVKRIEDRAFAGTPLTALTVPASVKYLGQQAFSDCENLGEVTITGSDVLDCEAYPFGNSPIQTLTLNRNINYPAGSSPFAHMLSLGGVVIGADVTEIKGMVFSRADEELLFADCPQIRSVYCRASEPADLGNLFDEGIYSQAVLYVPQGSEAAYRSSEWWGKFSAIEADPTGVDIVEKEGVAPVVNGLAVTVPDAAGIAAYTLDGRLAAFSESSTVTLPAPGPYVVVTAGRSCKVLVR